MDLNTGSNSDPHADRYGHRTSFPGSGSLPPSVLSRILDYTTHRIVNQGGADIPYVVNGLARMALVCKVWKRAAYLEREKGWLKAGNERMSNTGYNSALNKQLESLKGRRYLCRRWIGAHRYRLCGKRRKRAILGWPLAHSGNGLLSDHETVDGGQQCAKV